MAGYTFSYTGSVRKFTATAAATFDITGYGARGGANGGSGAEVGGYFALQQGEVLKITVGGAGRPGYGAFGGGGGASVVLADVDPATGALTPGRYAPLLVAGGGGGGANSAGGNAGYAAGAQGSGAGGAAGSAGGSGGGGAGANGNGGTAPFNANGYTGGHGGTSPGAGPGSGTGGVGGGGSVYTGGNGGFGGGGGRYGGGGGGGFTGGDGGSFRTGGGGTSLNTAQSHLVAQSAAAENAANADNGKVVIATTVCFAAGTRIRVARGGAVDDVPVEHLAVGDLAVTSSGEHRPIRWLGHRRVDCRSHPHPHAVMPVRIAAHAFADNRPARDLVVSPGHALGVDVVGEVLIMALALVNGTTITQEDVDHVTYWHVELDDHDILLAENMPAESYLDMGNRGFFAESDVVDLDAAPDAAIGSAPVPTHADFCRPFHMKGALVEVVRAQLAARARRRGWHLEEQGLGDLHLEVDGARIEPRARGFVARFAVPAEARDVWLVSRTGVAAEVFDLPDTRRVGVCLKGLDVDDGFGALQTVAVDDPRLCVGFHEVERDGAALWRWTAGRARLPASLWAGAEGELVLRVTLAGPMLPRWAAPAAEGDGAALALAG